LDVRFSKGHCNSFISIFKGSKHWANETSGEDGEPVEPLDFCQVMPEPFPTTGRICNDAAEGRLNAKSLVLQGSQVRNILTNVPLNTLTNAAHFIPMMKAPFDESLNVLNV
jgi:hypothetical protein